MELGQEDSILEELGQEDSILEELDYISEPGHSMVVQEHQLHHL
jgi:hypothetical protein